MKPERHQRIGELYHEALRLPLDQRAAFLAEACAGDEGIRQEVESLLALDSKAESFIESPALEIAAKAVAADQAHSFVGKKVDHYQILSLVGTGGMGEVYRARDSRLGREVAIKVLPAAYSADSDRLRRFEQDAQRKLAFRIPEPFCRRQAPPGGDGPVAA